MVSKANNTNTSTSKSKGLDTSDLNGDISSALIKSDSHFGLGLQVWENAQRIADLLPFPVTVFGDIDADVVAAAIETSKGMKLESSLWKEYATAISATLKEFQKIKEQQINVAENVAEARLQHTEMERSLQKNLAALESKYRQTIAGGRSDVAGIQDELSISLNKIVAQYSQSAAKRQEALTLESQPKEDTEFRKQELTLVDQLKAKRASRYNGAMAGLSQRIG